MKKLLTLIAVLTGFASYAQRTSVPAPVSIPTPYAQTGQMLNLSNTNANATLDTATNATTLYLATASYNSSGLPVKYAVYGQGLFSVIVKGLKISGSPSGSLKLQESYDGTNWADCRAIRVADAVDTILNQSAAQYFSFDREYSFAPYHRVAITTGGSQVSSWAAWWFFNQNK